MAIYETHMHFDKIADKARNLKFEDITFYNPSVGMQNSEVVHSETINVSIGKRQSVFNFSPYTPTVDGDIVWTVTIDDDDPDADVATASTTVNP